MVLAIRAALNWDWDGHNNLMEGIIEQIPDTRVRDRLIQVNPMTDLKSIGSLGSSAYVVNSVPLALAAASRVLELGLENMFRQLIDIGGDTDTNCSIAGQIAGTLLG